MATINELLRKLKKNGWYLHRHGKKHDVYIHDSNTSPLIIPRHGSKEMAKGTYNSILKTAGLK